MKEYRIRKIMPHSLKINGRLNSPVWKRAELLTDFSSPWNPAPFGRTEFRALWDGDYLYFGFTVFEREIHIDREKQGNAAINDSDRVELFFRNDLNMQPYYCLEMDTECRIMDFKARPHKLFDFDWKWPLEGLHLESSGDTAKYQVEGRISLASLDYLKLRTDNRIEAGIYRASYRLTEDNQRDPQWICWVNPQTETPNFHIASSFGTFILEN